MAYEDGTQLLTLAEFNALSGGEHSPPVPLETQFAINAVEEACTYLSENAQKLNTQYQHAAPEPVTEPQTAPATPKVVESVSKGSAKTV